MGQSQHHWKTRIMFLFAVLLLGVGIQAAPQHSRSSYYQPKSSYQPKCSYQPKEDCTTVYENVERKVTNVECHTEYGRKCQTEYKQKCTRDHYGRTSCNRAPHQVCENKPHEVCHNVLRKKTEKVPSKHCKTVQKNSFAIDKILCKYTDSRLKK